MDAHPFAVPVFEVMDKAEARRMLTSSVLYLQHGHRRRLEEERLGRASERQSNIPVLTDRSGATR